MLAYIGKLTWNEFKARIVTLILTFIVSSLVGWMFGSHVARAVTEQQIGSTDWLQLISPLDFVLLALLPWLGSQTFTKEYMFWSTGFDEPYLKRLRFYRMWAIPTDVIAWSRVLHMLICFAVAMIGFCSMFLFASLPDLGNLWSAGDYAVFLMLWIGFALIFNALNPYLEFGFSGKAVLLYSLVFVISLFAIIAWATYALQQPIYSWTIAASADHPWLGPAVLAIGAGNVLLIQRLLARRLTRKGLA
ncbi:hypothetical protein [Paenibacillus sp. 1P07SE]|uniref:hypothetical protein n=1 Tax=Paenibacillus sp. 1P07SE TaxID=3132209 RepID=UPI0039A5C66D